MHNDTRYIIIAKIIWQIKDFHFILRIVYNYVHFYTRTGQWPAKPGLTGLPQNEIICAGIGTDSRNMVNCGISNPGMEWTVYGMESGHGLEPYKIIAYGGAGEIEEKKSRFIAHVSAADTEEEALAFIEAKRKQYWDARHNCYAYVLGEQGQTLRFSDDGEPAGTAGRPILEVLINSGIRNLVVVVTRYFGGVLLGTGGLVRAYTKAAQAGLAASDVRTMCYGYEIELVTDYNGIGKIQYLLGVRKIPVDAEYGERVHVRVRVPYEDKDAVVHEVTEATAGRTEVMVSDPFYFMV